MNLQKIQLLKNLYGVSRSTASRAVEFEPRKSVANKYLFPQFPTSLSHILLQIRSHKRLPPNLPYIWEGDNNNNDDDALCWSLLNTCCDSFGAYSSHNERNAFVPSLFSPLYHKCVDGGLETHAEPATCNCTIILVVQENLTPSHIR